MDMSPGDFISLIYLLKVPRQVIDLKVRKKKYRTMQLITMQFTVVH